MDPDPTLKKHVRADPDPTLKHVRTNPDPTLKAWQDGSGYYSKACQDGSGSYSKISMSGWIRILLWISMSGRIRIPLWKHVRMDPDHTLKKHVRADPDHTLKDVRPDPDPTPAFQDGSGAYSSISGWIWSLHFKKADQDESVSLYHFKCEQGTQHSRQGYILYTLFNFISTLH